MSESRDVEPGCLTIFAIVMLISALWGISARLDRIATALERAVPVVSDTTTAVTR